MAKSKNWRALGARIEKQTSLALIYLADGAHHTAAKILAEIAEDAKLSAAAKDRSLNRYIAAYNRRADKINEAEGRAHG